MIIHPRNEKHTYFFVGHSLKDKLRKFRTLAPPLIQNLVLKMLFTPSFTYVVAVIDEKTQSQRGEINF